jgi:hypothetical protein
VSARVGALVEFLAQAFQHEDWYARLPGARVAGQLRTA